MADVLTTIGLKDDEFTGGLSRLEAFVNNFRRRMESSPIKMGVEPSGNWKADNPLYWSQSERQQYIRQAKWSRRGQDFGAIAGEVSNLYSAASSVSMMVSEVARYVDQLEYMGKQHERWKKEIDAIGDAYLQMIDRARAAADPIRGRSMGTFTAGSDAANETLKVGQQKMEELSTYSALYNTGIPTWWKSYRVALDSQNQANKISQIASREALRIRKADAAEAEDRAKADLKASLEDRLKSGQESTSQTFETFNRRFTMQEAIDRRSEMLSFENSMNRAQVLRLSGREKEGNLLEARVQYESKLSELMHDQNASEEDKIRNAATLAELYRLQTGTIAAAQRPQMLVRAFSMSDAGGSATLAAALATGTQTQQKSLESIEKTSKESADSLRQIKDAVSQGAMRAVWN